MKALKNKYKLWFISFQFVVMIGLAFISFEKYFSEKKKVGLVGGVIFTITALILIWEVTEEIKVRKANKI